MSEPFVGEIRMFGFDWAPRGWAICDGALMATNQNQALFSLLGLQFGGNGTTNFALPDMRSRTPMHSDNQAGFSQGISGGYETVVLSEAHLPAHSHTLNASNEGSGSNSIGTNSVFNASTEAAYHQPTNLVAMNNGVCKSAGGAQGHNNIQPSLGIGFCIALQGIYPSRN